MFWLEYTDPVKGFVRTALMSRAAASAMESLLRKEHGEYFEIRMRRRDGRRGFG